MAEENETPPVLTNQAGEIKPETPPTNAEVNNAVKTASANLPDNPTAQDMFEMINSLPDRIVDALREASTTKSTTKETQSTTHAENAQSSKDDGWFGYGSFGNWWTGKKS